MWRWKYFCRIAKWYNSRNFVAWNNWMWDPGEARGNSITARELLDVGAEKIEDMLTEQPETRAELMATMGGVYRELGLYPQAEPLLEQALAERQRVLGASRFGAPETTVHSPARHP